MAKNKLKNFPSHWEFKTAKSMNTHLTECLKLKTGQNFKY
jgi:hypothetical protein